MRLSKSDAERLINMCEQGDLLSLGKLLRGLVLGEVVGGVHALTASGAVSAGVDVVELNHATVVVAATIADLADHRGLFAVVNNSSGGVIAHTLTLTKGTFNGTNKVATLNAPGEMLLVYVGEDGNGTVILNNGAVALSG